MARHALLSAQQLVLHSRQRASRHLQGPLACWRLDFLRGLSVQPRRAAERSCAARSLLQRGEKQPVKGTSVQTMRQRIKPSLAAGNEFASMPGFVPVGPYPLRTCTNTCIVSSRSMCIHTPPCPLLGMLLRSPCSVFSQPGQRPSLRSRRGKPFGTPVAYYVLSGAVFWPLTMDGQLLEK